MKPFSSTNLLLFLLLLCTFSSSVFAEEDAKKNNTFREREATDDALGYPEIDEDALVNSKCPMNLELRWQTEVSSSVYANPLIADINSDGKLDIVVPSFVHYLEVLEGTDGDKMPGWPAFHQSTVHSSPLLYDIDKDGVREIALATYNGEVLFFRVSGYIMSDKLEVPRRKVLKNWHVGLNKDPVDRTHPDVHDDQLVQEATIANSMSQMNGSRHEVNSSASTSTESHPDTKSVSNPEPEKKINGSQSEESINTSTESHPDTKNVSNPEPEKKVNGSQSEEGIKMPTNSSVSAGSVDTVNADNKTSTGRRLLEDNLKGAEQVGSESKGKEEVHAATVENEEGLEADADSSFELFRNSDDLADEYNYDYDDYVDESLWGDEEWIEFKEQDRFLPIANVARIMKRALPENAKIAKEAKECVQECVSEFISFITSEASDRCQQEKRKTINGEDILWAMQSLGFENYADALKIYLAKYRETTKIERSSANSKEKEEEGANVTDMYSTQQSQQHATAGYYPVQHQNYLGDNNPS